MTDKGRQIEEMAKFICACEPACTDCGAPCLTWKKANRLYDAGYRKQSEVVKEYATWLREHVYYDEQMQLVEAFCEHFVEDEQ